MPSVTLGDLKARVYGRIDNNVDLFPAAEVARAINCGIGVLNLFSGFLQKTAPVDTVAGQYLYSTPTGILIPLRVDLDDSFLDKTNLQSLNHSAPAWMLENSANTGQLPYHWCPVGVSKFVIHPADSVGGRQMDVTGVAEPTPLVNDGDVIGYPNEFADAIEDYAAHYLMLKCGGVVAIQAMYQYAAFMRRANELKRYKSKIAPTFRVEVEAPK